MRTLPPMFCTALVALLLHTPPADAGRVIRIDTGTDWDTFGPFATEQTVETGFALDLFGVTGTEVTISPDGTLTFGSGGSTATLSPFAALSTSDTTFTFGRSTPTANFPTGIDAGFRVTWASGLEPTGIPTDSLQLALFALADSSLIMEFNYESLLSGEDHPFIGYSTNGGTSFDLLSALGLTAFADYGGVSINEFNEDLCPLANSGALVCNNFNSIGNVFGVGSDILPAGFIIPFTTDAEYFRINPSTFDPINGGRYSFTFANATGPVTVPEPSSGLLLLGGLLGLAAFRRLGCARLRRGFGRPL
ncbi:MAG TPA: PEP-CTERM sorting domain-containing protein [Gammaproteobacteria bacterium]|nr:PEP-CTERM sorting domain-containing protein [Gammaproteobacteria bacterium]